MNTITQITRLLAGAALLLAASALAQTGQTVTWSGGNTYRSWLGVTNWNPQVVALNHAAGARTFLSARAARFAARCPWTPPGGQECPRSPRPASTLQPCPLSLTA